MYASLLSASLGWRTSLSLFRHRLEKHHPRIFHIGSDGNTLFDAIHILLSLLFSLKNYISSHTIKRTRQESLSGPETLKSYSTHEGCKNIGMLPIRYERCSLAKGVFSSGQNALTEPQKKYTLALLSDTRLK